MTNQIEASNWFNWDLHLTHSLEVQGLRRRTWSLKPSSKKLEFCRVRDLLNLSRRIKSCADLQLKLCVDTKTKIRILFFFIKLDAFLINLNHYGTGHMCTRLISTPTVSPKMHVCKKLQFHWLCEIKYIFCLLEFLKCSCI